MLKKRILQSFIVLLILFPALTNAQVTTSSITGNVRSSSGTVLEGASTMSY